MCTCEPAGPNVPGDVSVSLVEWGLCMCHQCRWKGAFALGNMYADDWFLAVSQLSAEQDEWGHTTWRDLTWCVCERKCTLAFGSSSHNLSPRLCNECNARLFKAKTIYDKVNHRMWQDSWCFPIKLKISWEPCVCSCVWTWQITTSHSLHLLSPSHFSCLLFPSFMPTHTPFLYYLFLHKNPHTTSSCDEGSFV